MKKGYHIILYSLLNDTYIQSLFISRCILECEMDRTTLQQSSCEIGKHDDTVSSLAIGDYGSVLSGSVDGVVKFWRSSKEAHAVISEASLQTGKRAVVTCSLFSDETTAVTGCEGGEVKVWDLKVMKKVSQCQTQSRAIKSISVPHVRSNLFCWGSGKELVCWDMNSNVQQIWEMGDQVTTTTMSMCGSMVAAGTEGGKVFLWDRRAPRPCEVDFGLVSSLKFNHSGCFLGCGSKEPGGRGGMELWDIKTQGLVKESRVASQVSCLTFSTSDQTLLAGMEGRVAKMELLQESVSNLRMDGWGNSKVWDITELENPGIVNRFSTKKRNKYVLKML